MRTRPDVCPPGADFVSPSPVEFLWQTPLKLLSHSVVSSSVLPYGLEPAGFLYPWTSPGKSPGVGCHAPSSGSSQPRDRTWVSRFAGRFFTNELLGKPWPSKGPVILWGLLLHLQTLLARQGSLMWGSELSLLWENFSHSFSVCGLPMWPVWDLILSWLYLFYHLLVSLNLDVGYLFW